MPDLPPGFTPARGRAPSERIWGSKVMVQLRCGVISGPWPIRGTRWTWEDHPGDVVAIRKCDD